MFAIHFAQLATVAVPDPLPTMCSSMHVALEVCQFVPDFGRLSLTGPDSARKLVSNRSYALLALVGHIVCGDGLVSMRRLSCTLKLR